MRDLTPDFVTALEAGQLVPVLFVHVEAVTEDLYVWSGIGTVEWNGETWYGVGDLGGIKELGETNDIKAVGLELTLNGVPTDMLSFVLSETASGKAVSIWFGFCDPATRAIVADPDLTYRGKIDTARHQAGADTAAITISVENDLISLETPNDRRWTHDDQQRDYPGDRGFEYIAAIQDKEVLFG